MGYEFRCNACRHGHLGQPGNDGYHGGYAGIAATWHGEGCFTEWCVDEGCVVWHLPGGEVTGTHAGHDHRRFPRERSECVTCPVCGSSDIETRD